jgi:hypothetical protein
VQKVTIPLPDHMYGDNIGEQGHPGSNLPFFVRHFLLRYLKKKNRMRSLTDFMMSFGINRYKQSLWCLSISSLTHRLLSHKPQNLRHRFKNATMVLHELVFSGRRGC